MDPLESSTHAFIVKIWRERIREKGQQFTWRGQITHVPSGERCSLKQLSDLSAFMVLYLESLGVYVTLRGRVKHWIKRWTDQWPL